MTGGVTGIDTALAIVDNIATKLNLFPSAAADEIRSYFRLR